MADWRFLAIDASEPKNMLYSAWSEKVESLFVAQCVCRLFNCWVLAACMLKVHLTYSQLWDQMLQEDTAWQSKFHLALSTDYRLGPCTILIHFTSCHGGKFWRRECRHFHHGLQRKAASLASAIRSFQTPFSYYNFTLVHTCSNLLASLFFFDCLAVCPSPCFQDDACKTLDISLGVPWMCWRMGSLASWSCRELPFLLPSGLWEMHLAFPWRIWSWEDFHKVLLGHVEMNLPYFATSFPHQSQMNIFRCIALPSWYVSKILSESQHKAQVFNLQMRAWPWFFSKDVLILVI